MNEIYFLSLCHLSRSGYAEEFCRALPMRERRSRNKGIAL